LSSPGQAGAMEGQIAPIALLVATA
jgi:hypothetical protein